MNDELDKIVLKRKTKRKVKKVTDVNLALDILDVDKSMYASLIPVKRGAIELLRKTIANKNKIKSGELVDIFETVQCFVTIYDTGLSYYDEKLYVIISIHKNNNKINTRFANQKQMKNISNCYSRIN